ncbi:hypothetical protein BS78_01G116700 [Paspalum vaginatum]|nr:hypothetical protein BS78_01G116700 [Paspalum vaginatum]
MVIEEVDYHSSDSDGEDDVDRYVFLARRPATAGTHDEDDRDVSSANDDGGDDGADADATVGGEESEGGVGGEKKKKRHPPEISDDAPPPPTKARRLELIFTSPLAPAPPSGSESSDSAASPRGARSGSEGSHEKAHEHRAPREEGEAKNTTKKKRGACGKQTRGPSFEVDGDREPPRATAKAGASAAARGAPGRFLCHLCERCFESHQALGGHVLGHRKKAKIAIIAGAASPDVEDVCGIGSSKEETFAVAMGKKAAKADKKGVVAARRGKANGKGNSDEEKTIDDVAEHGDEDVDRGGHRMGNGGIGDPVFAGSQDASANGGFGNEHIPITVSSHGFADGNSRGCRKVDIGAASQNEGANGNSNVCRALYKCRVCDTECLTGRALGGHMRKHRKRSPLGGGCGEGKPPPPPIPVTEEDCQIPLAQLLTSLQREDKVPGRVE